MDAQVAQRETGAVPADTFAARLMLARAHAGHLSIREAADKCGLGRGAWTNWERGAQPVGEAQVAQAISAGLGIDRDWLLWGGPLATERRDPLGTRVVARAGRKQPTQSYGTVPDRSGCVPERRTVLSGQAVTTQGYTRATRRTGRTSRPTS